MEMAGEIPRIVIGSPKLPNSVDYCIVVQEFFQARVQAWFETVGKSVFNIEHYWIRYEFAPGRARYMLMSCAYQMKHLQLLQTLLGLMRMVLQNSLTTYVINMASPQCTEDENNSGQTPMSVRFSDVPDEKDNQIRIVF
jgi:hypothetical protein